jgi:methylmalonyl-CoA/ethylmalonyl-CoA epimerase
MDHSVITQIGIVVKDIEKTADHYAHVLGLERPRIILTDPVEQSRLTYLGELSPARVRLVSFALGDIHLDLIEPDESPSLWRTFLEEKGEGILHIAFVVKDMDHEAVRMESRGMPMLHHAEFKGGRYAYFDTVKDLKIILELMEFDRKE